MDRIAGFDKETEEYSKFLSADMGAANEIKSINPLDNPLETQCRNTPVHDGYVGLNKHQ